MGMAMLVSVTLPPLLFSLSEMAIYSMLLLVEMSVLARLRPTISSTSIPPLNPPSVFPALRVQPTNGRWVWMSLMLVVSRSLLRQLSAQRIDWSFSVMVMSVSGRQLRLKLWMSTAMRFLVPAWLGIA